MRLLKHAGLWLCLTTAVSQAAVMKTLDLDELAAESSAIVQGQVLNSRCEWNSDHTSILTIYTVRADRYLRGFLGATFELIEPGGELDGLAMSVPGAPRFRAGEEAVFFVWTDNFRGRHQTMGFEQGAFRVRQDPATGLKFLSRSAPLRGGEASPAAGRPRSGATSRELQQFLMQVREALERVALAARKGVRQ